MWTTSWLPRSMRSLLTKTTYCTDPVILQFDKNIFFTSSYKHVCSGVLPPSRTCLPTRRSVLVAIWRKNNSSCSCKIQGIQIVCKYFVVFFLLSWLYVRREPDRKRVADMISLAEKQNRSPLHFVELFEFRHRCAAYAKDTVTFLSDDTFGRFKKRVCIFIAYFWLADSKLTLCRMEYLGSLILFRYIDVMHIVLMQSWAFLVFDICRFWLDIHPECWVLYGRHLDSRGITRTCSEKNCFRILEQCNWWHYCWGAQGIYTISDMHICLICTYACRHFDLCWYWCSCTLTNWLCKPSARKTTDPWKATVKSNMHPNHCSCLRWVPFLPKVSTRRFCPCWKTPFFSRATLSVLPTVRLCDSCARSRPFRCGTVACVPHLRHIGHVFKMYVATGNCAVSCGMQTRVHMCTRTLFPRNQRATFRMLNFATTTSLVPACNIF